MNYKRVVFKIGTSVLADGRSSLEGKKTALHDLISDMAQLRSQGTELILVSSGAIGLGLHQLGWKERPKEIRKVQAAAAVGQVSLMEIYRHLFKGHGFSVAQVLLTRSDLGDPQRTLNFRHTLLTLLEYGVIPIINENDTVAVEEIRFGDNDELSSLVATKIDADLLLLLTDVDGLYRLTERGEKEVLSLIPEITTEIEAHAWKGVKSSLGKGGMTSKIDAAKIATEHGVATLIVNAFREHVIREAMSGHPVGTKFLPRK